MEPRRLDLHYYLPLFFDGLRETRFPESMLARQVRAVVTMPVAETDSFAQGVVTLIEIGGDECVSLVGKLIQPIKGQFLCSIGAAPFKTHTDFDSCLEYPRPKHNYSDSEHGL